MNTLEWLMSGVLTIGAGIIGWFINRLTGILSKHESRISRLEIELGMIAERENHLISTVDNNNQRVLKAIEKLESNFEKYADKQDSNFDKLNEKLDRELEKIRKEDIKDLEDQINKGQ